MLAAILASSHLFQNATLGRSGLSASSLVRFLGDVVALALIWRAAARAAATLEDDGNWRSLPRHTLTPLATLIVLAVGYGVPLFVYSPRYAFFTCASTRRSAVGPDSTTCPFSRT